MAEAAPYLFDRMFEVSNKGSESAEAAAAAKREEEWERKMADACLKSFEEGEAAGKAEALQQLEAETLQQVNAVLDASQKILGAVERECDQVRRNAIGIAQAVAELLAGELISRHPELNTEALFSDALEYAGDAPHIAVTVNDAHAERVQTIVTKLAAERGFDGKIVVLGDPETAVGDCSLQWADGGVALETDKLRAAIAGLVRSHLDRIAGGRPPHDQQQAESQAEDPIETEPEPDAGPGEAQ